MKINWLFMGLAFIAVDASALGGGTTRTYSLSEVRSTFAGASVDVVSYVPPAEAAPGQVDDNTARPWLELARASEMAGRAVIWVCDSPEQAVLLAQKRSQALANTNRGDFYGGPFGWFVSSPSELKALRAQAFVPLQSGRSVKAIPPWARRFVLHNLVLEASASSRSVANEVQAQVLVTRLQSMRMR